MKIITDTDLLRIVSSDVVFDAKAKHLAQRLLREGEPRHCVGLAAPQIRVHQRAFFYNLRRYPGSGGIRSHGVVCNPTVVEVSDETEIYYEGCLSIPRYRVQVARPVAATFDWFTPGGEPQRTELDGFRCRVWLHEIDHLDGVLMTDRMVDGTAPARL